MRYAVPFLKSAALAVCAGVSGSLSYSQSASDGKPISLTQGPLASVVKPYIDRHELAGAVILAADRDRVIDRRGHRLRGHRQPQSS
jgi:hypothetical protein